MPHPTLQAKRRTKAGCSLGRATSPGVQAAAATPIPRNRREAGSRKQAELDQSRRVPVHSAAPRGEIEGEGQGTEDHGCDPEPAKRSEQEEVPSEDHDDGEDQRCGRRGSRSLHHHEDYSHGSQDDVGPEGPRHPPPLDHAARLPRLSVVARRPEIFTCVRPRASSAERPRSSRHHRYSRRNEFRRSLHVSPKLALGRSTAAIRPVYSLPGFAERR